MSTGPITIPVEQLHQDQAALPRRIASVLLWAALGLACVAVLTGYRNPGVLGFIVVLGAIGLAALAIAAFLSSKLRLEEAIRRLLDR